MVKKRILTISLVFALLASAATARDLETIGEAEPLRVSGGTSLTQIGYTVNDLATPVSFMLSNQDSLIRQAFNQFGINPVYYMNTYIAYFIERSVDGTNFTSISKDPIVLTEDGTPTGVMHVIDSLKDNGTTYHYRIMGVSVFGVIGPYSPSADGHGKKPRAPRRRSTA